MALEPSLVPILVVMAIGFVAGVVGGLCGIGGSIVMLPALGLAFGYPDAAGQPDPDKTRHHLYMASAMFVNAVIAILATVQHRRANSVDGKAVRWVLPPMALLVIAGARASDQFQGEALKLALVVFLFAFCGWTVFTAVRKLPEPELERVRHWPWLYLTLGAVVGVLAGFLGIGGGIVLVPCLQVLARMQLRRAIATSATVMGVTAAIGATTKLAGLGSHGYPLVAGLGLGAAMGAGALIGAPLGAKLTHALPTTPLRVVVSTILAVAGARLAGWI